MRIFIAVDCNIRDRLRQIQQEILDKVNTNKTYLNIVNPDNMHFTLSFLGEMTESQLEKIKKVISEIKFNRIPIIYNNIGVFPSINYVKVIWVGIDNQGSEILKQLHTLVYQKLNDIGIKTDNRFAPHLTIFRVKNKIPNIDKICNHYNGQTFGQDLIDKFYIKKSDLTPNGPIYSNLLTINALN
ncbi:MAG: RNA 2',3'-cyclic phosphodiesterase [Nitrososphaeraceae archaeon]|nr:RNA 2',3'-cyclic phosphodiesterase [Nitrososphaeraceae archaeon]